jgi:hypothetical protein
MAAITITSKKYLKFFFTLVPFISAGISTIHLLNLFDLGNANWLSILLSIAFEIGSISAFLMMSEFKQKHTFLKWFIFLILFFMQIIGNIYYSFEFINMSLKENPLFLESFTELANVFIMFFREEALTTSGSKFLLSCLVGLPVPIISLAFLKARMNLDIINDEEKQKEEIINNTESVSSKTLKPQEEEQTIVSEEDALIEKYLNAEEDKKVKEPEIELQKEEEKNPDVETPVPDIDFQLLTDLLNKLPKTEKEQEQIEEKVNLVQVIEDAVKNNNVGVLTTTNVLPNSEPLIIDLQEKKKKEKITNNTKKKKNNTVTTFPSPASEAKNKKQKTTNKQVDIPEQTLQEKKQEENLLMMTTISVPEIKKKEQEITDNKKKSSKKIIVEALDLDDDFKVPHINN